MQPVPKTPVLQVSETRGSPVATPYGRFTPIARVVRLRWPGVNVIWNRAVAIEVNDGKEGQEGQEPSRVPVRDVTTQIVASIFLSGVIVAVSVSLFLRKRRRRRTS